MAVNLSRNTKVYFTTNTGDTGYDNTNTFEIQVLDGYSFSQGTEAQNIQINEAGPTPNRGQRSFNTQLNPVDWSFGSYIRPTKVSGGSAITASAVSATAGVVYFTASAAHNLADADIVTLSGGDSGFNRVGVPVEVTSSTIFKYTVNSTVTGTPSVAPTAQKLTRVTAVEKYLWNALAGIANPYDLTGTPAWSEGTGSASLSFANSNVHQLATFALVFKVDNVYYKVNNCAINQAEINFAIDAIAQVNWSGFGTTLDQFDLTSTAGTEMAAILPAPVTADFITNKLSTTKFNSNISGDGTAGGSIAYNVPITGGSLTISNNIQYLTPQVLGIVNTSIGYFTGSRSISGTLTAYLRTGSGNDTGKLLTDILASSAVSTENKYHITIGVGGLLNIPRVEFDMNGCQVQVPTSEIADVVSTTINFTAQAYNGSNYDIEQANELAVTYYGKVPS